MPEPSIPTDATNTAPDEKFREFSKLFSPANPGPITPVDGSRATNETNSTGTAQIRKKEDILLNKEDAYERTPVKDPLFAAKILEEEQKPYVSSHSNTDTRRNTDTRAHRTGRKNSKTPAYLSKRCRGNTQKTKNIGRADGSRRARKKERSKKNHARHQKETCRLSP